MDLPGILRCITLKGDILIPHIFLVYAVYKVRKKPSEMAEIPALSSSGSTSPTAPTTPTAPPFKCQKLTRISYINEQRKWLRDLYTRRTQDEKKPSEIVARFEPEEPEEATAVISKIATTKALSTLATLTRYEQQQVDAYSKGLHVH